MAANFFSFSDSAANHQPKLNGTTLNLLLLGSIQFSLFKMCQTKEKLQSLIKRTKKINIFNNTKKSVKVFKNQKKRQIEDRVDNLHQSINETKDLQQKLCGQFLKSGIDRLDIKMLQNTVGVRRRNKRNKGKLKRLRIPKKKLAVGKISKLEEREPEDSQINF